MSVPTIEGQSNAVSRQTGDPLLFDDMGISKEMAMLLGTYYWMCERTFGAELAKEKRVHSMTSKSSHGADACRSENDDGDCGASSSPPTVPLFTPLPCVKATARCLEGCEGVSAPTAVVSMKTNSGAALKIVFRRDANGVPIMEL